ncbi:hypothetical protein COV93_08900 [Candidatus Woesearchaeota archaeon CG11_big_fil_rev_8_21_14_0_20_43_8]|nr:MAG: hypothetical protein COV93_08900 [Candidatus Woesearchaeota archaeon CG11_big_fil_rev_8_21_14_0_20_43_8]PIO06380.1 MAG: hypothetical protein COT47_03415 [Candidatus Woesearchaeota archaeon CG08_land_8_20_14_0_20_43_7]
MLDNKKIKEIEQRVGLYLKEGTIKTRQSKDDTDFFLCNSKNSLESAQLLLLISTSKELQETTGFLGFNGFLWAINASYYSMFYMARALLENSGIRLRRDLSIHSLAFDAIVHFFYMTGKFERQLIEDFIEAKEESAEILGKETADELVHDYFFEKNKRGRLTYETGELAMLNKARTSLERAEKFSQRLKGLV